MLILILFKLFKIIDSLHFNSRDFLSYSFSGNLPFLDLKKLLHYECTLKREKDCRKQGIGLLVSTKQIKGLDYKSSTTLLP